MTKVNVKKVTLPSRLKKVVRAFIRFWVEVEGGMGEDHRPQSAGAVVVEPGQQDGKGDGVQQKDAKRPLVRLPGDGNQPLEQMPESPDDPKEQTGGQGAIARLQPRQRIAAPPHLFDQRDDEIDHT